MAVGVEIRHPQSETAFSPQKTQNIANVIKLKNAALGGFRLGMPHRHCFLQNIIPRGKKLKVAVQYPYYAALRPMEDHFETQKFLSSPRF
jgi:hypothetical protein